MSQVTKWYCDRCGIVMPYTQACRLRLYDPAETESTIEEQFRLSVQLCGGCKVWLQRWLKDLTAAFSPMKI